MFPFRRLLTASAVFFGLITSYSIFANPSSDNFDRFDGTGKSGAKIDVIEWEGNIEIHGNTPGKILGLGAKLDDREKNKKVLVIGFRLPGASAPLVRRATLGVPFTHEIKAFRDPTAKGYDKFAITNQDLKAPWVPYKLDPAPKQWYPEGHPKNMDQEESQPQRLSNDYEPNPPTNSETRSPASVPTQNTEDNEIRPFTW